MRLGHAWSCMPRTLERHEAVASSPGGRTATLGYRSRRTYGCAPLGPSQTSQPCRGWTMRRSGACSALGRTAYTSRRKGAGQQWASGSACMSLSCCTYTTVFRRRKLSVKTMQPQRIVGAIRHFAVQPSRQAGLRDVGSLGNFGLRQPHRHKLLQEVGRCTHGRIVCEAAYKCNALSNYVLVHSYGVQNVLPHELVKALVDRDGGSLPVAKAMKAAGFQPTLHKFISGHVAQPHHATASRIANHFGVPVAALYDANVATEWFNKLRLKRPGDALDPEAKVAAGSTAEPPPRSQSSTQGPPSWPLGSFLTQDLWGRLSDEQRIAVAWEAAKVANALLDKASQVQPTVDPWKRQANGKT